MSDHALQRYSGRLGVVIIAARVTFHYDDISTSVDGPREIELRTGVPRLFVSEGKCVTAFFVAATIAPPNEEL